MSKISELPPLPDEDVTGNETLPVVKNGMTRRAALGALAAPVILQAETARDVALANAGPFYQSVPEGEAATPVGQIFLVAMGGALSARRRIEGGSAEVFSHATTAALASAAGADMLGLEHGKVGQALLWTVTPQQFDPAAGTGGDDTGALLAMYASGARRFDMGRDRTYRVNIGEGNFLGKFIGGQVEIFGENVKIKDVTSNYTVSGAFTQVFWAQGTTRFSCVGVNYEGPVIASPGTNLGYIGASFVRATHGASNTHVEAYIENAQHGIHSGAYNDVAYGGCNGFTGKITAKMVGYPIAIYLADNVFVDVEADGFHRAAYLAGVQHSGGIIRSRNQYVAPIALLFTDAKTGVGTSRACAFAKWQITDTGSTTWIANSWLAGISPSRADPLEYHDIEVNGYVVASDTVAATMGLFAITSAGPVTYEGYPFNWEQSMALRRIKIGGVVDRSVQTITEHSTGEIYIQTNDNVDHGAGNNGTHYATCAAIDLTGVKYLPGSGPKPRVLLVNMPGHQGTSNWSDVDFSMSMTGAIVTNTTSTINMYNVRLKNTYADFPGDNSRFSFDASVIGDATQPTTNKTFGGGTIIAGTRVNVKVKYLEVALAGAAVNVAAAIPGGCTVKAVATKITEAIPGPTTGYQLGTTASPTLYANRNDTAFGAAALPIVASTATGWINYPTATALVVTAKGGDFSGGKLGIMIYFETFDPIA